MNDTMIGVDLAKNACQPHAASMTGQVKFKRKLSRRRLSDLMAGLQPAVAVFEACGSASYSARHMAELGREAELIAAHQ